MSMFYAQKLWLINQLLSKVSHRMIWVSICNLTVYTLYINIHSIHQYTQYISIYNVKNTNRSESHLVPISCQGSMRFNSKLKCVCQIVQWFSHHACFSPHFTRIFFSLLWHCSDTHIMLVFLHILLALSCLLKIHTNII